MASKRTLFCRGLSALLAAALCCMLLPGTAAARETHVFNRWLQDVPLAAWDSWKDSKLDQTITAELNKALESLTAAAGTNAPATEVTALYEQAREQLSALQTNYTFTEIACGQSQASEADLDRWRTALENGRNAFAETERLLFSGVYQAEFREMLGGAYVDAALAKPVWGEAQRALQTEEQELLRAYGLRSSQVQTELTYEQGGVVYTIESINEEYNSGRISEDAYYAVYGPLVQMANAEIGPIYLELVDVRNRLARSLGYENYAEYAFSCVYGWDYSVEEGLACCMEIIEEFSTLLPRLIVMNDPDIDENAGVDPMFDLTVEEMVAKVQPHLDDISSELAELFQYMLDNRLLYAANPEVNLTLDDVGHLESYDSAFLLLQPQYRNAFTLLHLFGRFANSCLAPDSVPCTDVGDLHSLGMEAMFISLADRVAGKDNAPSLRSFWIRSMLTTDVLNFAVLAAFELEVYTRGDMSLEEMNRQCGQLIQLAGFRSIYGGANYSWYQESLLFQNGCYYLSRTIAAVNALELLLHAGKNFDRAADQYLSFMAQTDVSGYTDAVEAAGLTNIMEPGTLKTLVKELEGYLARNVWEVGPFSDVPEDHWAYSGVLDAVANEIMTLEEDGSFTPGRVFTGAELNAAMDWLVKDEPGHDWGAESEEEITREKLILMLYRFARDDMKLDVSARTDLSVYSDADQLTGEARDAMSWAAARHITAGTSAKTLSPDAPATRAQAAVILMRFFEGPYWLDK